MLAITIGDDQFLPFEQTTAAADAVAAGATTAATTITVTTGAEQAAVAQGGRIVTTAQGPLVIPGPSTGTKAMIIAGGLLGLAAVVTAVIVEVRRPHEV